MGFESLLGSPSPIPELCVVGKNEMGTTEDVIGAGGGNCRWQTCVKHMCNGSFSPASARNYSLFFLSSHVSRSVSPTTTSQIQARKKRRGVSLIYVGGVGIMYGSGCAVSPWGVWLVPAVCQGSL